MNKLLYILLSGTLFMACTKENSDVFVPYPTNPLNDTAWVASLPSATAVQQISTLFSKPVTSDSFDANIGDTLHFPGQLDIYIPAHSLNLANGSAVQGKVIVEVNYLKTRGDMVRFARPTTSFNRLLESGGAVYVRAFREGQEVSLASNKNITIRMRDSIPMNVMKVFYGQLNVTSVPLGTNAAFTWVQSNDSSRVSLFQRQDTTGAIVRGYELSVKNLRWINCDYFIDSLQPKTRINALLPPNFSNTNTSMYAVFRDQKIIVRLNAEFESRSFFAANMPVNKNIVLVSLSKVGDDLFLGSKDVTITSNLTTRLTPERKTKAQIDAFLDAL